MLKVYLDRNVFADLCDLRRGITEDDLTLIRQSVDLGKIKILGSHTIIEETVKILLSRNSDYSKHIKLVLSLIDRANFIKGVPDLLKEDLYQFAFKLGYNSKTFTVSRDVTEVLDLQLNQADLVKLANESKKFYEQFAHSLNESFKRARELGMKRNVGTPDNFLSIWNGLSESQALSVTNFCRPEIKQKCLKRGAKRLLEIKSVRLFTVYLLSLVHTSWFGVQGAPRKITGNDAGDYYHAIYASAADIFVTQENKTEIGKLPYILTQISIPRLQIVNLSEFLQLLQGI